MKQPRDAAALAASLTNAANAPLPLPERATALLQRTETPPQTETRQSKKAAKVKIMPDTVGMTLRPTRELLNDYTIAAAERTKAKGRVDSAQEIMLEALERGRPKVQK